LSREIVIEPRESGHICQPSNRGALDLDFSWDPNRAGAASELFAPMLNRFGTELACDTTACGRRVPVNCIEPGIDNYVLPNAASADARER
jgi:hypothetical protein